MIPKIIHFCWLSDEEYPDSIKECISSWKKYLPDYELRKWDRKRFDVNSRTWTKQAFEAKKYAFAADFIRLYALYQDGGIYLDSDVTVYKSFNDLLHLSYFIGEERTHCFEAAVIGCEPGCWWIKDILDRYNGLDFVSDDGSFNMRSLPKVFADRLFPYYQFRLLTSIPLEYQFGNQSEICVFSWQFFNSRDYIGPIHTEQSFCSHNFAGSWEKKSHILKRIVKILTPRFVLNYYYSFMYSLFYNKRMHNVMINYSKVN